MANLFHRNISLVFNRISQYINVFVPSWHEFKNTPVELAGLLHSQPFTNSHDYFFIIAISANPMWLFDLPNEFHHSSAFTSVPDMVGRSIQLSSWMSVRQFSNCLYHFMIFYTLVKPSPQTSKHWKLTTMEQIYFARIAPSFIGYLCYKCYFLLKV